MSKRAIVITWIIAVVLVRADVVEQGPKDAGPSGLVAAVAREVWPTSPIPFAEVSVILLSLVPISFSVALLRTGTIDIAYLSRQAIIGRGFSVLEDCPTATEADVAVVCREGSSVEDLPVIYASHLDVREGTLFPGGSLDGEPLCQRAIRMASTDVIGLSRLVRAIGLVGRVEGLFANILTRSGHATQIGGGCVDRLEPLPDDTRAVAELAQVLDLSTRRLRIRRVRVPYTHSNLHVIGFDLDHKQYCLHTSSVEVVFQTDEVPQVTKLA